MSLTRIKEAFSILKVIVAESRTASSNNGKQTESNNGHGSEELLRQIEDLKSCLVQRDTEIAILVNMVKKGKNSTGADATLQSDPDETLKPSADSDAKKVTTTLKPGAASEDHVDGRPPAEAKKHSKVNDAQKVVKRFLFNIPPPEDRKTLEDIAGNLLCKSKN